VNFTLPKIGRRMTPGQSRRRRGLTESTNNAPPVVAFTSGHFPVRESERDPMSWRIECINLSSAVKYKGHHNGKRCGAKIAKYRRTVPCPTFTGIELKCGTKSIEQKQF
jgi:hypothetical protein